MTSRWCSKPARWPRVPQPVGGRGILSCRHLPHVVISQVYELRGGPKQESTSPRTKSKAACVCVISNTVQAQRQLCCKHRAILRTPGVLPAWHQVISHNHAELASPTKNGIFPSVGPWVASVPNSGHPSHSGGSHPTFHCRAPFFRLPDRLHVERSSTKSP